jgi:hypothetical protein
MLKRAVSPVTRMFYLARITDGWLTKATVQNATHHVSDVHHGSPFDQKAMLRGLLVYPSLGESYHLISLPLAFQHNQS